MVTLDDRLSEPSAGASGWWRRPLALGPSLVLPVALVGSLTVAAMAAWMTTGWGAGESGSAQAAVDSGAMSLAAGPARSALPQACGRIHAIVETACGYKQHDHDAASIGACVTYELKYTMWSAYGCQ